MVGLGETGASLLFASAPIAVLWWTVRFPRREKWSSRKRLAFHLATLVLGLAPILLVLLGLLLGRRDRMHGMQDWKIAAIQSVVAAQIVATGVFIGMAKGARGAALASSAIPFCLGLIFGLLALFEISGDGP